MTKPVKEFNARMEVCHEREMCAWLEVYHSPDGQMMFGIECDDPTLTFDGHYVCVFPPKEGESYLDQSQERAQFVLDCMLGEKKISRGVGSSRFKKKPSKKKSKGG